MIGPNRILVESAFALLKEEKAAGIVVFLDAIKERGIWQKIPVKDKLILVTQKDDVIESLVPIENEVKAVLKLPPVKLTRLGSIKLATVLCLTSGVIRPDDKVIYLTGASDQGTFDTVISLNLAKENEVISSMGANMNIIDNIRPEVLDTVLNIALELSSEGREAKPVGTTFVIGDNERVSKLSRPLILNPFKGYPESARNILDESVHETIKEFSLLDGAFIIHENGVVMAAGVHLDAALKDDTLLSGLGSRHMAAAGITDVTAAAAVSISGSTGIVRIFKKGKVILEIERPPRHKV
jgi:DNA integrity scanning protein DisA with diadenylate cyclase activity